MWKHDTPTPKVLTTSIDLRVENHLNYPWNKNHRLIHAL